MQKSRIIETMPLSSRKLGLVFLLSGITGWLVLTFLYYSETGNTPSVSNAFVLYVWCFFCSALIGLILYQLNNWLNRYLTWNNFPLRFISGYLIHTVFAIAAGMFFVYLYTLFSGPLWEGFSPANKDIGWKFSILMIVILFVYDVVYALLFSYQQYEIVQIENLQNQRRQLELQFEALKSQISPHYLFNSLNTISSLLYNDPQSAEQFIRRLSQTYAYILSTQQKEYVSVREEVEFVKSYYYLLRIRFQQLLTLEINLPNNVMNTHIPPLTLQMLVENAVKHNAIQPDRPLFIYISALDNTYLKVANTKSKSTIQPTSFKVGLENIKQRYLFLTNKKILVDNDAQFIVSLPVIKEIAQQKNTA